MVIAKRIFLFLAVNFLVMIALSLVLNFFHIEPFLQEHGLNLQSLLIFCLIWGMGGSLISLLLSRRMAKWMMGVKIIDPLHATDPEQIKLLNTVERLCRDANLFTVPQVGIFASQEPNAFATGFSKKHSLIAVSTGLLQRMNQQELEGVLAHEMAHICNGDMVTMTLLQGIVNAFVMFLARVLAYAASGLGKSRNSNSSGGSVMSYHLFVILFEVLFMVLGSLVVCAFSRFREFRADRGGANLAGREKMIAALESLQRLHNIQDPKIAKPAMAALQISSRKPIGWKRFFATHPPLEERIARLKEFA